MSETIMLTSNPYDAALGERIGGTVGQALPDVSVRVVDEAGAVVPTGDIGNVQVRGPHVFSGYWRMAEKTRQEFTAEGRLDRKSVLEGKRVAVGVTICGCRRFNN